MIPALRQEKILDMLQTNEIVLTEDIMRKLDISISTLRRDLLKLKEDDKIILLHGGVKLAQKPVELPIATKLELNKEAKEKIAAKAATLIEDGEVVFLDPSSTTFLMIPYLAEKKITVITNSISHINQLIALDIPCVMIGGSIKKNTNSCIGAFAENLLNSLNFNKCFLGASGFSLSSGITNHDISEKVIKQIALQRSGQAFFLLDSSKYGLITLVHVADLNEYPILVDKIPEDLKDYDNLILCE